MRKKTHVFKRGMNFAHVNFLNANLFLDRDVASEASTAQANQALGRHMHQVQELVQHRHVPRSTRILQPR